MLKCPACGFEQWRVLRPRGVADRVRAWLGIERLRCGRCGHQTSQSVWLLREVWLARCPNCFNRELTHWSERRVRPTFWQQLKIALGGKRVRCARCRVNFVSFRFQRSGPGRPRPAHPQL